MAKKLPDISFPNITMALPQPIKDKVAQCYKQGLALAPKHALMPFSLLPNTIQEKVLTWALNYLFKVELADEELDFLINKWLKIIITDANYHCYITVNQTDNIRRCQVILHHHAQEEIAFQADSISLLELFGQTVDPDTLFFQRKLLITGDTELGLEIKNFLDDVDRETFPFLIKQLLRQYKVLST